MQYTNLQNSSELQCCDFYSKGLGYQFTICDNNVGVYILDDRKGTASDLRYLNMPLADIEFGDVNWEELINEIDKYCMN